MQKTDPQKAFVITMTFLGGLLATGFLCLILLSTIVLGPEQVAQLSADIPNAIKWPLGIIILGLVLIFGTMGMYMFFGDEEQAEEMADTIVHGRVLDILVRPELPAGDPVQQTVPSEELPHENVTFDPPPDPNMVREVEGDFKSYMRTLRPFLNSEEDVWKARREAAKVLHPDQAPPEQRLVREAKLGRMNNFLDDFQRNLKEGKPPPDLPEE